jgi:hypothetical protein
LSDLASILEELRSREPIFHTRAFGNTRSQFEAMMSHDYWEIGASGRRYTREFILEHLERNPPVDAADAGWTTCDHAVRQLGPGIYLFTYTLAQGPRISRRATIWQQTAPGWQILFHQGTIVSGEKGTY